MNPTYPPIGTLKSCFTEKFGVPRQSLMVSEAMGLLKLNPDPAYRVALNHLERFSHVWIVYVFNQHLTKGWTPTIRPPRVGAPNRVGVFASRSPHRPNPIGISVVKLDRIDLDAPGGIELHLSGVDMMDGTPVLDIKPYLPFADSVPGASSGWAEGDIPRFPVSFSLQAIAAMERPACRDRHPRLQQLVAQMLEWDPRPTSQRKAMPIDHPDTQGKAFAFRVLGIDVKWEVRDCAIQVVDLIPVEP